MTLSRRNLLRNFSRSAGALALSPVLAPVLAQLEAHAAAGAGTATGGAKRFVFVLEGNGLPARQITPAEVLRGREHERTQVVDRAMRELTLPRSLEPLAPWQDRVSVVNGLSGKICGGGHSNNFGALGVFGRGTPASETIDAALGKRLGGVFPLVGLGISDKPEHNVIYNCSAW